VLEFSAPRRAAAFRPGNELAGHRPPCALRIKHRTLQPSRPPLSEVTWPVRLGKLPSISSPVPASSLRSSACVQVAEHQRRAEASRLPGAAVNRRCASFFSRVSGRLLPPGAATAGALPRSSRAAVLRLQCGVAGFRSSTTPSAGSHGRASLLHNPCLFRPQAQPASLWVASLGPKQAQQASFSFLVLEKRSHPALYLKRQHRYMV
jgi:hypothetical protein